MADWIRSAALLGALGVAACGANATSTPPPSAPVAASPPAAPSAAPAPSPSVAAVPPPSAASTLPPSAPPAPSSPAETVEAQDPYAEGSVYLTTTLPKFDLRLTLGKECDEERYLSFECKQPGKLEILEKGTTQVLQTIKLDEVRLALDEKAEGAVGEIAGYGSVFGTYAFDDYNFDGEPDLAVVRNNWGLYRGAMYTIFLWDKKQKRFVLNKPLTKLTETDILDFDAKEKLIGTTWKDGCCQHIYRYFRMVNDRPKLIYKLVLVDGDHHEERLVKGVWKRRKVTGEEDNLHPSLPLKP